MKRILFNDRLQLTAAVLSGRKTMTRRIVPNKVVLEYGLNKHSDINYKVILGATYKLNEAVAVAQSYKDLGYSKEWVEQHISPNPHAKPTDPFEKKYPGWSNKMFTPSELNKAHQIRITGIKVERLQDISIEDCMREGVLSSTQYAMPFGIPEKDAPNGVVFYYANAREAFAALIDKVSGKGTWDSNPYVFCYTFYKVKK